MVESGGILAKQRFYSDLGCKGRGHGVEAGSKGLLRLYGPSRDSSKLIERSEMMAAERDILSALESSGVRVIASSVVLESRKDFGNIMIDVDSSLGRLRITSDRSQIFVDRLAADGTVIRGVTTWPSLVNVYRTGKWTIADLVRAIKEEK